MNFTDLLNTDKETAAEVVKELLQDKVFDYLDNYKLDEALDKDNLYHTSIENGIFSHSQLMNNNKKYLHDKNNAGGDNHSMKLATFGKEKHAKSAAKKFGGTVEKMPMGTFRIHENEEQIDEGSVGQYAKKAFGVYADAIKSGAKKLSDTFTPTPENKLKSLRKKLDKNLKEDLDEEQIDEAKVPTGDILHLKSTGMGMHYVTYVTKNGKKAPYKGQRSFTYSQLKKSGSKLVSEDTNLDEEQLDELSPTVLGSYIKKSNDRRGDNSISDHELDVRSAGVMTAADKLGGKDYAAGIKGKAMDARFAKSKGLEHAQGFKTSFEKHIDKVIKAKAK